MIYQSPILPSIGNYAHPHWQRIHPILFARMIQRAWPKPLKSYEDRSRFTDPYYARLAAETHRETHPSDVTEQWVSPGPDHVLSVRVKRPDGSVGYL
jgi:hypothetical protein